MAVDQTIHLGTGFATRLVFCSVASVLTILGSFLILASIGTRFLAAAELRNQRILLKLETSRHYIKNSIRLPIKFHRFGNI